MISGKNIDRSITSAFLVAKTYDNKEINKVKDTKHPIKAPSTYTKVSQELLIPSDVVRINDFSRHLEDNLKKHRWKMDMPPFYGTIAEVRTDKEAPYDKTKYASDRFADEK